jgi:hypothetical protein
MIRFGMALAAAAALFSTAAQAQSPAYVGTWASNPLQCVIDQSLQAAPLILSAKRYDQHEAHCDFTSVKKIAGNAWRARARCSVEGDRSRSVMTMAVKGNMLTIRDGGIARTLMRC